MQERESVWEGSGFKRTMSTRLYTFSHSVLDGSVWNTRAVWFSLRGETRSHPHLPLIGYFLIHLFTPQPPAPVSATSPRPTRRAHRINSAPHGAKPARAYAHAESPTHTQQAIASSHPRNHLPRAQNDFHAETGCAPIEAGLGFQLLDALRVEVLLLLLGCFPPLRLLRLLARLLGLQPLVLRLLVQPAKAARNASVRVGAEGSVVCRPSSEGVGVRRAGGQRWAQ
jgi:hypothetical protein